MRFRTIYWGSDHDLRALSPCEHRHPQRDVASPNSSVKSQRPDPERSLPNESFESSPSLPRPFLEDLGRHQDVANPITDSERHCPQETVPPPSGDDSGSKNRDVSNLRPDSKRRCQCSNNCRQKFLPAFDSWICGKFSSKEILPILLN